jgi:uncharacterized membrane protein
MAAGAGKLSSKIAVRNRAIWRLLPPILALRDSFWFLPSMLGLLGLLLGGVAIWVDRSYDVLPMLESLGPVTTRAVLQTIANSVITIISLTYSITLVVFTLAAGNIGPRLLERFRESMVARLSIGIFCCTFLFTITVLNFVGDNHTPRLAAAIAFFLAIASIYTLIVYVHSVSTQVLVDNEVARAAGQVRAAISDIFRTTDGKLDNQPQLPTPEPKRLLCARKSGYVRLVETEFIRKTAAKHDCFVQVSVTPGDFIIESAPLGVVYGPKGQDAEEAILDAGIVLGPSRQPDADISFSVRLLSEIAMRALSERNDSYTAISCIDYLSANFSQMLKHRAPRSIYCDEEGKPRLDFRIADIQGLLDDTMRPLRISSRGNVLVTSRLLRALKEISKLALPQYRDRISFHASLIMADAEEYVSCASDREHLAAVYNAAVEHGNGNA